LIEVEVKVAISEEERSKIIEELRSMCPLEKIHEKEEEDLFFVSSYDPSFGVDKTLKLRRSSNGVQLIFKSKRATKDLKENLEMEVGIKREDENDLLRLLRELGFRESVTVKKKRTSFRFDGYTVNVDDVAGLGSFLEVEVLVNENSVEKAYRRIASVLLALGLSHKKVVLKSYAEMLTAQGV
jgi:adenylate cyclase class 2